MQRPPGLLVTIALLAVATTTLAWMLGGGIATAQVNDATTGPTEIALLMPIMNPADGRALFASKGCVVCHSINGVGGTDASALDATAMDGPMNPFDFFARMWRGAPAMIAMQNSELGHQIQFTGQELADIVAFAHDPSEQVEFSEGDIPADIKELMDAGM